MDPGPVGLARLVDDTQLLWSAFERLHNKHGLPGPLEIPQESFARAVEIVLKDGTLRDAPGYHPDGAVWNSAAQICGYIQSRRALSAELLSVG